MYRNQNYLLYYCSIYYNIFQNLSHFFINQHKLTLNQLDFIILFMYIIKSNFPFCIYKIYFKI